MELNRSAEHEKYVRCYETESYRMGLARKRDATADLNALPCRGSYLDVGCGRGEMLTIAEDMGFNPVQGVEVVPGLIGGLVIHGEVHDLPFGDRSFDVVTMFDVIEHLIPGDDERACRELARVAKRHVILTACNKPSFNADGDDLHINRRPYDEWDRLFREWFDGTVTMMPHRNPVSETWRIDL